ncbi:MAG: hypothetical protein ACYTBJ_26405 [Planctomycetota bacterium]|jgi:hypothetical protein
MKTRDIIKQLEKLGDVDVKYVYDYGDRWRIVYLCDGMKSVTGRISDTDDFGEAFDGVFDDETVRNEAHMRG